MDVTINPKTTDEIVQPEDDLEDNDHTAIPTKSDETIDNPVAIGERSTEDLNENNQSNNAADNSDKPAPLHTVTTVSAISTSASGATESNTSSLVSTSHSQLSPKSSQPSLATSESKEKTETLGSTEEEASKEPVSDQAPVSIADEPTNTTRSAQSFALDFFNGTAGFLTPDNYAGYMGEGSEHAADVRTRFMALFSWQGKSILGALRNLCDKIYMKAESQQLNRIMESFSIAWCDMNPNHGFSDSNIVYTIAYSLLLLNTDLYAADHSTTKRSPSPSSSQTQLKPSRAKKRIKRIEETATKRTTTTEGRG